MEERTETLHPEPGKKGVSIIKHKYDTLRHAIPAVVAARGKMTCRHRVPTG